MRFLIATALCLLLLISVATAQGNGNIVTVTVKENITDMSFIDANFAQIGEASANLTGNDITATQDLNLLTGDHLFDIGQSIVGANSAQIEEANADLAGNNIQATQKLGLRAGENQIVGNLDENGLPDGKTNFIQKIDVDIKDTGNNNIDEQNLFSYSYVTLLTVGNVNQMITGRIEDSGNNNHIIQDPDACVGSPDVRAALSDHIPYTILTRSDFIEAFSLNAFVDGNSNYVTQSTTQLENEDHLTDSQIIQESVTDAYVDGNINIVNQSTYQSYGFNDLVGSRFLEQAVVSASILGNNNNLGIDSFQLANQNANATDMTNSLATELICLDEQIIGNSNDANQIANTDIEDSLLTSSMEFQSIDAKIREFGNYNFVEQNVDIVSDDSTAVGGRVVQQIEIETNS